MPPTGWRWTGLALAVSLAALSGCGPTETVREESPMPFVPPIETRALDRVRRHTVESGETLYSIGKRYNVEWRRIAAVNPWVATRTLEPGDVLIIPEGGEASLRTPLQPVPTTRPQPTRSPGHDGPLQAESEWTWPLRRTILSAFGRPVPWRSDEANRGMDIRAEAGDVVVAAKSGKVNVFEEIPEFGRTVVLEHNDGTLSLYGHLGDVLVPHGRWIRQGESLATAAGGAPLHFRIVRSDRFVDPMSLLPR